MGQIDSDSHSQRQLQEQQQKQSVANVQPPVEQTSSIAGIAKNAADAGNSFVAQKMVNNLQYSRPAVTLAMARSALETPKQQVEQSQGVSSAAARLAHNVDEGKEVIKGKGTTVGKSERIGGVSSKEGRPDEQIDPNTPKIR
ncbi:hypothetical protein JYU14_04545 [Simkania negevensis]|uniref:SMP domain-containing protein n=1 Tax=Simkania negevensis TaxID=83561 RepID=A0ABS3ASH7_9BACT|nr:hypothetical protein [Simkania negevensis]